MTKGHSIIPGVKIFLGLHRHAADIPKNRQTGARFSDTAMVSVTLD